MSSILITASMLYDLVACPHRVSMDLFADPNQRDKVSPFVQLLWDRGIAHETDVVARMSQPFTSLVDLVGIEKEKATLEAMEREEPLIYGGRISIEDLLGEPDLLRREGSGYVAGDIKSGAGQEGGEEEGEGRPKKHYAVQLALYTDILERAGRSSGRRGFIWDVEDREVIYDFTIAHGVRNPRSLWEDYIDCLAEARAIANRVYKTTPAYSSGTCKNCVWYSTCLNKMESIDDLTLIPELGRSKREAMIQQITSIKQFAESNPASFISGKKTAFAGIGPATLEKLYARAKLLTSKKATPYLRMPVSLPVSDHELFFDIEVDPMRDVCYLHGFVERIGGEAGEERFVYFFAAEPTADCEKDAFEGAWRFLQSALPCRMYYYSKYERTIYRKLQQKYPDVCTASDIESLFDPSQAVDLYFDVVLKATEWPTRDFSIKTLAKYLGFTWRDTHPSGAASIEWFDRWVQNREPAVRQRILDYNEDDCRATRVLLDAIRKMPVQP